MHMTRIQPYVLTTVLALSACSGPNFFVRPEAPHAVTGPEAKVIGIVRVPSPWYAPRFVIRGKFRDSVPEYEHLPGLESKYFTISDQGEFGGIYVWRSQADADAFYTKDWRQGIRERRGHDPNLRLLKAVFEVEARTSIEGEALGERAVSYPATATLVMWNTNAADESAARRLAEAPLDSAGLLRAYVVTGSEHEIGIVAGWANRDLAEAALSDSYLSQLGSRCGGTSSATVAYFDAPVLIDDLLRRGASDSR
jgi:hypothetical protein